MFTAAAACSQEKDTPQAAQEVLDKAFADFGAEQADLAFAFASCGTYDHPTLTQTLFESGKIKNLVGGTASGEVCQQQLLNNSLVLMLLRAPNIRLKLANQTISLEDSVAGGAQLAEQLIDQGEKPQLVILIGAGGQGPGTPFPGEPVLVGMQSVLGETMPIVGGGCGDELKFTGATLYFQDQTLTNNQAVAIGLYGEVGFGIGVRHGWQRIGRTFKITQAEGGLLKEIEGKKPRDLYIDHLGQKAIDQLNQPGGSIPMIYPLGIEIEGSDELLIRTPVLFNPDGSLVMGGMAEPGQTVCLTIGSRDQILEATNYAAQQAKDALGGKEATAVLFFNCICRKLVMGVDNSAEVEVLQKYFPSAPVAGLITYGEFAPLGGQAGKSFYHNQSAVILALA